MEEFKIKPTSATKVLDPDNYKSLKTKGEIKPKNAYWLCRIADSDVVEIKSK